MARPMAGIVVRSSCIIISSSSALQTIFITFAGREERGERFAPTQVTNQL